MSFSICSQYTPGRQCAPPKLPGMPLEKPELQRHAAADSLATGDAECVGHGRQSVDAAIAYVSRAHEMQSSFTAPALDELYPAAHAMHALAPGGDHVPAVHMVHVGVTPTKPALQRHSELPSAECVLLAHTLQYA